MRKQSQHTVIIALGTNYLQESNMAKGRKELAGLFDMVVFSRDMWTEAIGIVSPPYLNCLAYGKTKLSVRRLQSSLKSLERILGDSREERQEGRIHIDLDLLQYDDKRHHVSDWQREYIQTLYHEIETSL